MDFSALLLAGGRSSRMGRDKAMIEVKGRTLLQQQLELLRSLRPVQLMLSCPPGAYQPGPDVTLVADNFPGKGPLAGIERGLESATTGLLLVLAVDMPAMDENVLRSLLGASAKARGVVPLVAEQPEPLAAIYPRISHALALQHLREDRLAMGEFVAACYVAGLVGFQSIPPGEDFRFANWNRPSDLPDRA